MEKDYPPEILQREEDHLFRATIFSDDFSVPDVPCKLFLPQRHGEKPFVIFKPSSEQYGELEEMMLSTHSGLRFEGKTEDDGQTLSYAVSASYIEQVYFGYRAWGPDLLDCEFAGYPYNLHVVKDVRKREPSGGTNLRFSFSENLLLKPAISRTASYLGDVTCQRFDLLTFKVKEDLTMTLDEHFYSKSEDNGDLVQWSFLVGCVETTIKAADRTEIGETLLPAVEDFVLLGSLASRNRTYCLGWSANDDESACHFYKDDYFHGEVPEKLSLQDALIRAEYFGSFMNGALKSLNEAEDKRVLRDAIAAVVPIYKDTLDTTFTKAFTGLETLILEFKRTENYEFVLAEDEWRKFKKYLKKCIKNCETPELESEKREMLYKKLNELNRVSFREGFEEFVARHSLFINDLWPVFGGKEYVGLIDIRNKLVHGDPIDNQAWQFVAKAAIDLKLLVERMLLVFLGWDYRKSRACPNFRLFYPEKLDERKIPEEAYRLKSFLDECVHGI